MDVLSNDDGERKDSKQVSMEGMEKNTRIGERKNERKKLLHIKILSLSTYKRYT